jgi:DNA-binding NtrC family response regulator
VKRTQDKTTLDHEAAEATEPQCALVLYHQDGAKVVPLREGIPIVVGRAHPADVVVSDPSLSRRHARFLRTAEGIAVEDLGSRNGTLLRGARVTEGRLAPGDTVTLGGVIASINMTGPGSGLRGIEPYEAFHRRLAEEVTRARSFRRPIALVMLRAMSLEEGHVSGWAPRICRALRDVDHATLYGQRSLLVLLPEIGASEALVIARELVLGGQLGEAPLVAGVCAFPERSTAEELLDAVRRAARAATLDERVHAASDADEQAAKRERRVIVASEAMRGVYDLVRRVAGATIPVLVLGETGTGKEVIAAAIHEASPRRAAPMRSVNCGAIPATLIESALFGHEQGAFTGAERAAPGLFEQADGGTVFLDEVGELSLPAQAALLRVLETKRVTRVGAVDERAVDVRVIAATHRDLEQMAASGEFRLDLLYRLNAVSISVPPLRARTEEIAPLADLFLAEACRASGTVIRGIDADAAAMLAAYGWPGNVRELRNVIERAVIVSRGETIGPDDLPERLRAHTDQQPMTTEPPLAPLGDPDAGFKDRMREYETRLILDALDRAGGSQKIAAKLLKMPLRTLSHKIKLYGIKKSYEA